MKTLRRVAHEIHWRMLPAVLLGSIAIAASAQAVRVPDRFRPPTSWADLADAVAPAVVAIHATTIEGGASSDAKTGNAPQREQPIDPYTFFFGEGDKGPQPEAESDGTPIKTGGTGFLVSKDGLIVTNVHVIEGAQTVEVMLDGRTYPARVRGSDPLTDIALLQIDAGRDLPFLELADSDASRVGDWVMVIGNPLALDKTVTTGIISAKGREIGVSDIGAFENFIQTDAPINAGNSGGPMVDMQGHAVGVTTAVNFGAENIGFAVPSNMVRDILPQLRDIGRVRRGYLGFVPVSLKANATQASSVEGAGGLRVDKVESGTPAHKAGLRRGDLIVSIDGHALATPGKLTTYVSSKAPGTGVTLELIRDGKPLTQQITLGERPDLRPASSKDRSSTNEHSDD
ncbi:MAG: trypsin-like peptidase domain-containing protein [Rhodanobacteraceae bacterium]|nr:trypsin-like peptidase domain-containing protein [Rhodanobacteraceae bacterium]